MVLLHVLPSVHMAVRGVRTVLDTDRVMYRADAASLAAVRAEKGGIGACVKID